MCMVVKNFSIIIILTFSYMNTGKPQLNLHDGHQFVYTTQSGFTLKFATLNKFSVAYMKWP